MRENTPEPSTAEQPPTEAFGASLIRCFREEGLPLVGLPYCVIQQLKQADRVETIRVLRGHGAGITYAMIQRLKTESPERIAARLMMDYRIAVQQSATMALFMC